jgi:cyclopropane fatty-acyl-phospholipid synthase-like methyltransferase
MISSLNAPATAASNMPHPAKADESVLSRELEYHEKLYSGFAQSHFARPAVRAFREHLVERIVRLTNVTKTSRVLSLGCGIGDTELLLARHASELVGVDLSPAAVKQAQSDATRLGITNVHFIRGNNPPADSGPFDVVIGVFFLHHLSDDALSSLPERVSSCTAPGSRFYVSFQQACMKSAGHNC